MIVDFSGDSSRQYSDIYFPDYGRRDGRDRGEARAARGEARAARGEARAEARAGRRAERAESRAERAGRRAERAERVFTRVTNPQTKAGRVAKSLILSSPRGSRIARGAKNVFEVVQASRGRRARGGADVRALARDIVSRIR